MSKTDPDATLITRAGKGTFPAYKAHFCVDRKERVIIAIDGSSAIEDDMSKIDSLYNQSYLAIGKKPETIIADSHYGGIEALKYYQDRGINTCIYPRTPKKVTGKYQNTYFKLSDDKKTCICPSGYKTTKRYNFNPRYRIQYRFPSSICNKCQNKKRCTDSKSGRMVSYFKGDYYDRANQLTKSISGKKLLSARQVIVEGVIGEAKELHNLNKCRYRSLRLFKLQLFLTASVINLKRLIKKNRKRINDKSSALDYLIILRFIIQFVFEYFTQVMLFLCFGNSPYLVDNIPIFCFIEQN